MFLEPQKYIRQCYHTPKQTWVLGGELCMSLPSNRGVVCVSYNYVSSKGTMGNSRFNDDVAIYFGMPLAIGCACMITLICMLILIGVFFIMCILKISFFSLKKSW
jgi:hypothetical protein